MEVMSPSSSVEFNHENFAYSPTRFNWESCPLILPYTEDHIAANYYNPDFEFDFNFQSDAAPLSAEELFDSGKIKPIQLNPDSRFEAFKKTKKVKNFSEAFRRTPGEQPILRVSDILLEDEERSKEDSSASLRSSSASDSSMSWSRRWKIREMLLFRSASEGEDKYGKTHLLKKSEIDEKGVSAHESYYRLNREVSKEMKRKTFLPYKKTVLFPLIKSLACLCAKELYN